MALENAAGKPPGLKATLINCGLFLALDVFVVGAPMLGVYAGLLLLLWLVPRVLLAWRKPALRRHRASVALIVAGALAVDCGAYIAGEAVAERRVTEMADALARYKARHDAYPLRLQDLVPDYLPEVRAAKPVSLMSGAPLYLYDATAPALMYVSIPPFGRRVLNVVTREWTEVD